MISFISPKVNGRRKGPCLGIRYLVASLKNEGMDATIFEDVEIDDLLDVKFNSQLIGISLQFIGQIEAAQSIIRHIRTRHPDKLIIIGGPLVSLLEEEIQAYVDGDMFVSGEAESCLSKTLPLGRKQMFVSAIPPNDLDQLAFPFRDARCLVGGFRHTTMITSRGCPNHCTFCATTMKGTWRARSTNNIVQEVDSLKNHFDIKAISFIDDNFLGSSEEGFQRALNFANALIAKKSNIYWSMECCTNDVSYNLFEAMQQAGLRRVLFGIESAVEGTRKIYGKKHGMNGVMDSIEIARGLGIEISAGFIMFDPTTTMEHLTTNIDFLSRTQLATYASLSGSLTIYPNTPIAKLFIRKHIATQEGYRVKWRNSDERISSLRRIFRNGFKPIREFEAENAKGRFSALLRSDKGAVSAAQRQMDSISSFLCSNANHLLERIVSKEDPWTQAQEERLIASLSDKCFEFRREQI